MARWKFRIKLPVRHTWTFSLALTVEALQGKTFQDSLLSGGGRSVRVKISGGKGRPWGIYFGFYKARHIWLSDSAKCTVIRAVVLTQYQRVSDGQTDGVAIGSTALAKRRAVKINRMPFLRRGIIQNLAGRQWSRRRARISKAGEIRARRIQYKLVMMLQVWLLKSTYGEIKHWSYLHGSCLANC